MSIKFSDYNEIRDCVDLFTEKLGADTVLSILRDIDESAWEAVFDTIDEMFCKKFNCEFSEEEISKKNALILLNKVKSFKNKK